MKVLTPTVLTYIKVVLLVALVPAIIGFVIVLAERRFMGFMQVRLGPNRVGPKGTLQGLADLVKLVTKEDITPAKAEKAIHFPSGDQTGASANGTTSSARLCRITVPGFTVLAVPHFFHAGQRRTRRASPILMFIATAPERRSGSLRY